MLIKIVVVKKHERLEEAWKTKTFSGAAKQVLEDKLKPKGFTFDEMLYPVPLRGRASILAQNPQAPGFDYKDLNKPQASNVFILRAKFDNYESIKNLLKKCPDVVGVFADPVIHLFSEPYCGYESIGDSKTVAEKLCVRDLNLTGKNVRIAIVDSGIHNIGSINSTKGWARYGVHVKPGQAPWDHGTMCAFDALICAPDAEILDYALFQSQDDLNRGVFLSDAAAAFADLIDLLEREPGSLVVNNSWGIVSRNDDEPIGSPGNYSINSNHPFNQLVTSLVAAGADIFFVAGNGGAECPEIRGGIRDVGSGRSIHGANSHPDVVTVAAITTDNRRLGYSSQGPGGLYQRKPDIAAYSHFKGSGVYPVDAGTSAACSVASGVATVLREKFPNSIVSPYELKDTIQKTAIDINNNRWDYDLGYGIINPKDCLRLIKMEASA